MLTTQIDGHVVHVNPEGFMTDYEEWTDDVARSLAGQIGIPLTDEHWKAIRFAREDFQEKGESPTLRRLNVVGEIPTKTMFELFPKKPAKKLAYVAGLPKPRGCI